MAERVRLRITRINIEEHGDPSTVTIRAKVDSLEQLRQVAEECRKVKDRAMPVELRVVGGQPVVAERGEAAHPDDLEPVIARGLAAMQHSGQIARALVRHFAGRRLSDGADEPGARRS